MKEEIMKARVVLAVCLIFSIGRVWGTEGISDLEMVKKEIPRLKEIILKKVFTDEWTMAMLDNSLSDAVKRNSDVAASYYARDALILAIRLKDIVVEDKSVEPLVDYLTKEEAQFSSFAPPNVEIRGGLNVLFQLRKVGAFSGKKEAKGGADSNWAGYVGGDIIFENSESAKGCPTHCCPN